MKHGNVETETESANSSRGTGEPALAASKTDEDQEVVPQAAEVLVPVAPRAVLPGDEQQDQSEVIQHDVQGSEAVPAVAAPEIAKDGGSRLIFLLRFTYTSAPSEPSCFRGQGGEQI